MYEATGLTPMLVTTTLAKRSRGNTESHDSLKRPRISNHIVGASKLLSMMNPGEAEESLAQVACRQLTMQFHLSSVCRHLVGSPSIGVVLSLVLLLTSG